MEMLTLEKEYPVHVYDTGPDGKASLYSLFNFMQDIASEHAVKLGFGRDDLMKHNHFWVLSRMYAVLAEMPRWEDKIMVKTWPNGTDKLFAMRNYEVCFPDGRPVASALSSWLIVDRTTKKIQRPGDLLAHFHSEMDRGNSSVRAAAKLSWSSENARESARFRVKISDLDVNLHTNNVNYLKWVSDTYDINFTMNHIPRSVEINYLAESVFNDEIIIMTSIDYTDGNTFNHSILRSGDNKELCRMSVRWERGHQENKEFQP
jgi:medium-chain acyl-[acyl-carrier-protein] hydrolase